MAIQTKYGIGLSTILKYAQSTFAPACEPNMVDVKFNARAFEYASKTGPLRS